RDSRRSAGPPAPPAPDPTGPSAGLRRDSRSSSAPRRTSGTAARSTPPSPPHASGPAPSEGGLGFPGQGRQFFSGVELQHELANLRPQLAHLGFVRRLLVLGPRLEPALAGLDERVHPPLDLGLLEVVLAAHVHELLLSPDQLQEQFNLPP